MNSCTVIARAGFLSILFLAVAGTCATHASTLFSNTGQTGVGASLLSGTSSRVATDFTTNGLSSTITSTVFESFNSDNIPHNVTLSIFTNNGGVPGTSIGTFSTVQVPAFQSSFAPDTATTTGITLAPNTTYWEVMQIGEALGTGGSPGWEETDSQSTDGGSVFTIVTSTLVQVSSNSGTNWSNDPNAHKNTEFQLLGTQVPEPGSAFLVTVGAGVLGMRRRRS